MAAEGLRGPAAPRRKHLVTKRASIQMIVFGIAKDIAPIPSPGLHTISSLHPKAGAELRLAPP